MCPFFRQEESHQPSNSPPIVAPRSRYHMFIWPSGQVLFLLFPVEKIHKPPKEDKREIYLIEIQNQKQQRQEANSNVRKRTKAKESGKTTARTPYGIDRSAFYFKC